MGAQLQSQLDQLLEPMLGLRLHVEDDGVVGCQGVEGGVLDPGRLESHCLAGQLGCGRLADVEGCSS